MAYWILKIILTPILYVAYRIRVEGKEHLPTDGAVILAANHRSSLLSSIRVRPYQAPQGM